MAAARRSCRTLVVPDVQTGEWFSRRVPPREALLTCVECGVLSGPRATGWRAYFTATDYVEVLCPECSSTRLR